MNHECQTCKNNAAILRKKQTECSLLISSIWGQENECPQYICCIPRMTVEEHKKKYDADRKARAAIMKIGKERRRAALMGGE